MTLSKQLVALICGLVIVLFAGSFTISLQNTRAYLNEQLDSLAQDAATSLGFSASTHMAANDRAMVRSMADAVFDSGDYSQVRIEGMDGSAWVDRQASHLVETVPTWFVDRFPLETPEGSASVMAGWTQAGTVHVRSNPAHAYRQLWQTARDSLLWFLAIALLVIALGLVVLRLMLKPLKAVEAQAEAICKREFPIVEDRPYTLEFRRVVEAMNRLSGKVRRILDDSEQLAEKLRHQAFTDPVTGLANRRHFMGALASWVEDPERQGSGALLMLQLNDFKAYNQQAGYAAGDVLLRRCAESVQAAMPKDRPVLLSHTAGADFAVFIEQVDEGEARACAEAAARAVAALYGELSLPSADVAHIGAALYHGQTVSQWLAEADMALRQAQRIGANEVGLAPPAASAAVRGAAEWRAVLQRVLEGGTWELVRQPVFACADRAVLHQELFLRIPDPDEAGCLLPAGQFLPMVESVGLSPALDRAVISRVLDELEAGRHTVKQAINLSPASLRDPGFAGWLKAELEQRPDAAKRLVLEFPEYGAGTVDGLADLVAALEATGVQVALDHFGRGFSSLAQVRPLKVHYLKLDGGLVRSLASDADARFFVQALTDIAHGLDMLVVADSVESGEVWTALAELGVDAGRGYWLAHPE